jgi:iron-sulfur cluster repair protein YtfE (RIC family)
MKITDAFLGEHAVFYAQLDHLDGSIPGANSLAQVKSQGAMLAAALVGHAHLEEELLFTALERHIGPMGPLAVMRMEHDEIESALARLPKIQNLAEAQSLLLHAIQVARDHFAKEEQVLYPIAEQVLDTDTRTRLGRQWAERREVVIS